MDLLSAPNAPFLVAVALMIFIGALEGLSLIVGTGLSHHLDHLFGAHLDADGTDQGVLGWLHIGRAPILVLLVIFLMAFAITGFLLQWAMAGVAGHPLPAWMASIFAAACALPVVRALGGLIARAIPGDETTAVSEDSFVGRLARLTGESASAGRPAQAKLTDEHGQSHYLLIEPDAADVTFARGETILVVRRASNTVFKAIRNPRPDLL